MNEASIPLLRANLKPLKLPTMTREFEKLGREARQVGTSPEEYLLRLTESEVAAREAKAITTRVRQAGFPASKELEGFDFSAAPGVSKPKIIDFSRCEWVRERWNVCLVGSPGTGKTHLAVALGHAACRAGLRVRFATAGGLATELEEAQKQGQLRRLLKQLDRVQLLICDELGYVSFTRTGSELMFQVFGARSERGSLLITTNLPFGEWDQVFPGERMAAALLDRVCFHCHIFEMSGESYRFREGMKARKGRGATE